MSLVCRAGHASEEPDYCSVCGARIIDAPAASADAARKAAPPPFTLCPACGEPLDTPDARFCDVCRFDFQERKQGPPPMAAPPASVTAPRPSAGAQPARAWELVITVDPTLDSDPDPAHPCPADSAPRVIAIDRRELLVGRFDAQRDIHPEVPLFDPGASRRHAKLVCAADGSIALQDLASTNGSQINGVAVQPGTRHPLGEGDAVTIGRWTRITLRARRA